MRNRAATAMLEDRRTGPGSRRTGITHFIIPAPVPQSMFSNRLRRTLQIKPASIIYQIFNTGKISFIGRHASA
ncbi:hypothetical protein [Burkholderia sp. Bp8984]|uniref:hypothetical protein n=1 Tax=Burkholderia sp. Bp8984 TaxID=2184549 RepID=UPI000F59CC92|nr:hypothetical protein [Burkholderia sp. Bp8984]